MAERINIMKYCSAGVKRLLGIMYSMKPVDICSSYLLSGVFQFVLLTFVALSMSGGEETGTRSGQWGLF